MDRGALTDTNGREANFKNVIVVMTTNIGAQAAARRTIGFVEQNHTTDAMEALKRAFTPEFRNRLDAIVQFNALDFEHILRVVDKFLIELEAQLQEKHEGHEEKTSGNALPSCSSWFGLFPHVENVNPCRGTSRRRARPCSRSRRR